MGVDTRNKRSSAIFPSSPWRQQLPAPDSAVAAGDRMHTAYMYAFSTAAAPEGGWFSPAIIIPLARGGPAVAVVDGVFVGNCIGGGGMVIGA